MQIRLSPSMRSITISSNNGFGLDLTKVKGAAARHVSYRTLFYTVLALACLLPFVFILTAIMTLEGFNKCSSLDCLGRRLGPSFLVRVDDGSTRIVKDLYKMLDRAKLEEVPAGWKIPESYHEFVTDVRSNKYDAKTFTLRLKAMMDNMDREIKKARLAEQLHKHYAAISLPKGIYCLSLRLTDEYSSNAHARRQLPPPEKVPLLTDNSLHHYVLPTDNILAASVVATSLVKASLNPSKVVLHIITDKKTYPGMHSWFALNSLGSAIVEVKGVHQFDWLTRENVPVIEAMESQRDLRSRYHGDVSGMDIEDNPRVYSAKLQARSPKYISLLNHIRIYLPELFPSLNKVVFLDDDVVVQHDLAPLWEIDLAGKVNGAVETCRGEDSWVMSKRFRNYFNFSHPLINNNFDPIECAWAYGLNVFDLSAWRKTNIREIFHYWIKENLKSNFTLWKLGTLPPALIAFRGHVHPIDSSWHLLGLGYQEKTDLNSVRKAAVIHYNGQSKPWLDIAFHHLQPFWTKHVNYSNEFVRNCHILEPQ
ncbi:Hexosyltransferase [Rhynchospora pubera]|uniref:Hexosyltransferase n=1 Tax=Rhynchospora pubera TaxID=906938 RepID=A0AAV8F961_9POAL|nr:Hexosyltransferase [Rhynchospora pubera]KAJ4788184.1 Hexosyltransferase [Rhynchospora pubera]